MIEESEALIERNQTQLKSLLALPDVPRPLIDAMHYGVFNGGKRIRPLLVYLGCEVLGCDLSLADKPAAAIELVHAYSLIHDDLPAMDDDDLRRGKPTCHIKFGEATAILAGDALQTLAFETLSSDTRLSAGVRIDLIHTLATASGASGMVAGQVIDLEFEHKQVNAASLEEMHRRKTGDLIATCLKFAAIISNANPDHSEALAKYGFDLGLAFQIRDDILDITGDEAVIGKPVGSDLDNKKSTFTSLYGLDEASNKLHQTIERAIAALSGFGDRSKPLIDMARFIELRSH